MVPSAATSVGLTEGTEDDPRRAPAGPCHRASSVAHLARQSCQLCTCPVSCPSPSAHLPLLLPVGRFFGPPGLRPSTTAWRSTPGASATPPTTAFCSPTRCRTKANRLPDEGPRRPWREPQTASPSRPRRRRTYTSPWPPRTTAALGRARALRARKRSTTEPRLPRPPCPDALTDAQRQPHRPRPRRRPAAHGYPPSAAGALDVTRTTDGSLGSASACRQGTRSFSPVRLRRSGNLVGVVNDSGRPCASTTTTTAAMPGGPTATPSPTVHYEKSTLCGRQGHQQMPWTGTFAY